MLRRCVDSWQFCWQGRWRDPARDYTGITRERTFVGCGCGVDKSRGLFRGEREEANRDVVAGMGADAWPRAGGPTAEPSQSEAEHEHFERSEAHGILDVERGEQDGGDHNAEPW